MSADKRWRLVCYDVRDPRRYRRVYRIIRGRGRRIQYSIFRCRLDDREIERLRWQLAKVLDPEDSLLIVDLCPSCARRVIARNQVGDWAAQEPKFVVLGRDRSSTVARLPTEEAPHAGTAEEIREDPPQTPVGNCMINEKS